MKMRNGGSVSAFTLIEMVMVLAIVSLLVGVGITKMRGVGETSRFQRAKADISTLTAALRQYELRSMRMPSTEQGLAALVNEPKGEPKPVRWGPTMTESLVDGKGNPYHYSNPGTRSKHGFDVFSLGEDEVQSDDDIGNW